MYKKGSYIAFMTKQPEVHLNEMFGYNDLTEKDFKESEHIGFVMSVLDDNTYIAVTVRPLKCFECIITESDILHSVDESELTEEEKDVKALVGFKLPNVYYPQSKVLGESSKDICEQLTKDALCSLFPEEKIAHVEFEESEYLKSDLLSGLQNLFKLFKIKDRDSELEKACNEFEKILKDISFKEHYSVIVGVFDNHDKRTIHNYLVAIDLDFEEVTVMRNIDERTQFFRSLGPDYDNVYSWKIGKTQELLTKE